MTETVNIKTEFFDRIFQDYVDFYCQVLDDLRTTADYSKPIRNLIDGTSKFYERIPNNYRVLKRDVMDFLKKIEATLNPRASLVVGNRDKEPEKVRFSGELLSQYIDYYLAPL